jgi:multidrug transporter EmrE-like cation transporter
VSKLIVLIAIASIGLSAVGQILMKMGMSAPEVQSALSPLSPASVTAILASLPVWGGLLAYGASAVIWLYVLSRIDVSLAYPMVSLGFVLVLLLSAVVLKEPLSTPRIAGVLFIVAGVVMVGRS